MLDSKYKLGKIIGHGGMGRVYVGYNKETKVKVAVKQIIFPPVNRSTTRERAIREYEFLSTIDHPNIVKAYDFYEVGDHVFIVMEYAQGISLDELIQQKPSSLSLKEQLAIAVQIAQSVALVNAAGIVHRDIKPANIIVNEEVKNVKLLDLGLGKQLGARPSDLTQGNLVGTPAYMSPEQVEGISYTNSDVFSVGITLYQFFLWAKLSPFHKSTPIATWNAITTREVRPLWDVLPQNIKNEVPIYRKISALLEKALEKDHQKRFRSCDDFVDELAIIYQELKTDSTTVIKDTKRIKWQPSIEVSREQLDKLQKLRAKYGSDVSRRYKRRRTRKKKIPYAVMLCILLTGLLIGVMLSSTFFSKETPINIVQKPIKLSQLENLLQEAIILSKNKKYILCAQKLEEIEKISNYQISTGDPLCKLAHALYAQQWKNATVFVPAILKDPKYEAVGLYYCLRLFACLGQYHAVLVYASEFIHKYPQLQSHIFHPVFYYGVSQFELAFYRLNNWNTITGVQSKEKQINNAFLQFFILGTKASNKNWNYLDNFVEKNIQGSIWEHHYPLLKAYIHKNFDRQKKLAKGLLAHYPKQIEARYLYVLSDMFLKKHNKEAPLLLYIAKDYPKFVLAKILLQKWPKTVSMKFSYNKLLYFSYNHAVEAVAMIYAKESTKNKIENFLSFLERSNTRYRAMYQSTLEQQLKNHHKSMVLLWKAIRQEPSHVIHLADNKSFRELSPKEQFIFLLDLRWYFFRLELLDKNLSAPLQRRIRFAKKTFHKKILPRYQTKIFALATKYQRVPTSFLLKLYEKSDVKLRGQIIRCLMAKNYNRVDLLLKKYKGIDGYKLKTSYTIMQLHKSSRVTLPQIKEAITMLETCLSHKDLAEDALFSAEIVSLKHLQKKMDKSTISRFLSLREKTSRFRFLPSKRIPSYEVEADFMKYLTIDIGAMVKQIQIYIKLHRMSLAYRNIQFCFYLEQLTENKKYSKQLHNLAERVQNKEK